MTATHPDTERRAGSLLIAGVPVDDVDMDQAMDEIWEFVRRGRAQQRTFQVATVNVDFVVNAILDPVVARVLRSTALSIPDGMPLVWGVRLLGGRLRTRVAGADLVPLMCERAAQDGTRIALIGAGPGVADRAASLLRERSPGLDIIATQGPSFHHLDDVTQADIEHLRTLDADIGCFAFGHPKQDLFIERFASELSIPLMIGVGGSLDFLVGEQRRAPRWMQRTGLEWLHRAATDPRRLVGRYARDFRVFGPALVRQARVGRATSEGGTVSVDST
ncbi:MAG: WecB/TagA/CpsF family glycosyltransferase, partial [Ilumatobacter sp.]